MEECAVCWTEITNGSESSLVLSKAVRKMLKEELGFDAISEFSLCQYCIKDMIADYFI
jgi:hypothetical protein